VMQGNWSPSQGIIAVLRHGPGLCCNTKYRNG
jgi:hypothetical protein